MATRKTTASTAPITGCAAGKRGIEQFVSAVLDRRAARLLTEGEIALRDAHGSNDTRRTRAALVQYIRALGAPVAAARSDELVALLSSAGARLLSFEQLDGLIFEQGAEQRAARLAAQVIDRARIAT